MDSSALIDRPLPDGIDLDSEVIALGRALGERRPSLKAATRAAHDRAMALVAADSQLRAALIRLVDVAPACSGPRTRSEHLAAYLDRVEDPAPAVGAGIRAVHSPLLCRTSGRVASTMVGQMAQRSRPPSSSTSGSARQHSASPSVASPRLRSCVPSTPERRVRRPVVE